MEFISAGALSGILMIIGGISVYLQGSGRLPVSRSSEKQVAWIVNVGPIFRIGGPIMILGGIFKLFISL